MVRIFCLLFLLTLATRTSALPKPGGAELRCFSVTDPNATDIHLIFYAHVHDWNLYKRDVTAPLQSCSTEPGPVELDTCRVCLREEQVTAQCNLSDPSADVSFEAFSISVHLNKTQTPCVAPPTQTPAPPTTTPAPPTPTPAPNSAPIIAAGVGVGVGVVVVIMIGAVFFARKKTSCMKHCSHEPVPRSDQETEMEPTSHDPAANGHAATSPC